MNYLHHCVQLDLPICSVLGIQAITNIQVVRKTPNIVDDVQ